MFSKCKLVAGFTVAIYYTILLHQSYMDFLYFFHFSCVFGKFERNLCPNT